MGNIRQNNQTKEPKENIQTSPNTEVSSGEYFFSLLPDLPADFIDKLNHPSFKDVSPDIHFPLHATLYYLGKLLPDDLRLAMDWLNDKKALQSPIRAKVNSVSSFKKNGEDFVYLLDLYSEEIDTLNKELFRKFSHIRKDDFAFRAHMTLFYPTKKITQSQRKRLYSLFSDISEITFNQLAIGSVFNEKIEIKHLLDLNK